MRLFDKYFFSKLWILFRFFLNYSRTTLFQWLVHLLQISPFHTFPLLIYFKNNFLLISTCFYVFATFDNWMWQQQECTFDTFLVILVIFLSPQLTDSIHKFIYYSLWCLKTAFQKYFYRSSLSSFHCVGGGRFFFAKHCFFFGFRQYYDKESNCFLTTGSCTCTF